MEPITIALVAMATSAILGRVADRLGRKARKEAEIVLDSSTVEDRLANLSATLRESALLMRQVEDELLARADAAKQLKTEAEEAERLASLNAESRDAVQRLLRSELAVESRRSARSAMVVNALFFVSGLLASVAITLFVRPLWEG